MMRKLFTFSVTGILKYIANITVDLYIQINGLSLSPSKQIEYKALSDTIIIL